MLPSVGIEPMFLIESHEINAKLTDFEQKVLI